MKTNISYCDICKKRPSCEHYKTNGHTLDQIEVIGQCCHDTMWKNMPDMSDWHHGLCIDFIYVCQNPDLLSDYLQYITDGQVLWDITKALTERMVNLDNAYILYPAHKKHVSRRNQALKCLYPLVRRSIEAKRGAK